MKWLYSFLVLASSGLATAPPYNAAWENASRQLLPDAHRAFADPAAVSGPARRVARLGEAVTVLNLQPRTDERIGQARQMLEGLAAERANDEVDAFARFFLARLLELHVRPAEPTAARQIYGELLEQYPGHPLAERAAAQLVLIDAYADTSPGERQRRLTALEQLGPQLTTPSGRRDFYLNLGNAYIDFGLEPTRALDHLLVADRAGITHPVTQASTWIAIGELARATGQSALARDYYGRFLAGFPLDSRRTLIAQRLASLPAHLPTSSRDKPFRPGDVRQ
ncbi:MAG: hypothetical protein JWM32_2758 [Verrucomicrobia bacterium]|nr:hypothetical protein [Verrucomicrobiota bacterium]